MAQQRERRPLQEFVKFITQGAAVLGRIVRQGENDNGRFIILEPAGFRPSPGVPFQRFHSLAVGLATDLARQINPGETGALVLIVYSGARNVNKASPMKLFDVFELTADESKRIMGGGELPEPAKRDDEADVSGVEVDDLPF